MIICLLGISHGSEMLPDIYRYANNHGTATSSLLLDVETC